MSNAQIFLIVLTVFILISMIVHFFFALSMNKTLKQVPKEHFLFPRWFVWFMVLPLINLIFEWMLLPYGLPKALKRYLPNNEKALKEANSLFALGLTIAILLICGLIPYLGFLAAIPAFIIWIIYWAKMVTFRKMFLDSLHDVGSNS